MTTLSTHDTKRQEDVRARLAVLAEIAGGLGARGRGLARPGVRSPGARPPDPPTEYLLWQTLVGAWPIDGDRLAGYLRKAMREAKLTTSWTEPDSRYEAAVISFARRALTDAEIAGRIAAFVASIGADARRQLARRQARAADDARRARRLPGLRAGRAGPGRSGQPQAGGLSRGVQAMLAAPGGSDARGRAGRRRLAWTRPSCS